MKTPVLLSAILILAVTSAVAQGIASVPASTEEAVASQRVMRAITPALMQIGQESDFFLRFADQIRLTDGQRAKLTQVASDFRSYEAEKIAILYANDARLARLLMQDKIELEAVRASIVASTTIVAELRVHRVAVLLEALNTLTHEQHVKVVFIVLEEMDQRKANGKPDWT